MPYSHKRVSAIDFQSSPDELGIYGEPYPSQNTSRSSILAIWP